LRKPAGVDDRYMYWVCEVRTAWYINKKNPAPSPASYLGEEVPGRHRANIQYFMNRTQLETYFSTGRLDRFFSQYPDNESKAIYLYEANIAIGEALYTPLCILEVALRNKINAELSRKYGKPDWYADWYMHPVMRHAWQEISNTIRILHEERKPITPDKVIAGLTFGFWTSLFNERYESELWANLRFVFPYMPRQIRQRRNVSAPLNDIRRELRNRIYHNEPIIFNTTALNHHYQHIIQLLDWMGADLLMYNNAKDRFPAVFAQVTARLATL
jgi:hypothetical protein